MTNKRIIKNLKQWELKVGAGGEKGRSGRGRRQRRGWLAVQSDHMPNPKITLEMFAAEFAHPHSVHHH